MPFAAALQENQQGGVVALPGGDAFGDKVQAVVLRHFEPFPCSIIESIRCRRKQTNAKVASVGYITIAWKRRTRRCAISIGAIYF